MNNEEYTQTQQQLVFVAQLIRDLDLSGMLEAIEKADTLAPILDPTLWMKGHSKMDNVRKLAQAAKVFQDEVRRQIREEIEKIT